LDDGFFDLSLLALKCGPIAVDLGLLIGLFILLTLERQAGLTASPQPTRCW
jgi:hypothetical protein